MGSQAPLRFIQPDAIQLGVRPVEAVHEFLDQFETLRGRQLQGRIQQSFGCHRRQVDWSSRYCRPGHRFPAPGAPKGSWPPRLMHADTRHPAHAFAGRGCRMLAGMPGADCDAPSGRNADQRRNCVSDPAVAATAVNPGRESARSGRPLAGQGPCWCPTAFPRVRCRPDRAPGRHVHEGRRRCAAHPG
jgi:hypothetical protein